VVRETQNRDLGEQIVELFEKADEVEGVEMVANKKPLADALKALGVSATVETGAQCCEIHCDDDAEYHEYCRKLVDADAMAKLAEMGWVMVRCGDQAMSNEKPDYKIGFIEIECHYTGAQEKPGKGEDAEKIRKDAQKDAATEFERKTSKDAAKGNTVELDDPDMGGKREGIGKPSDGKDPEGKPKGTAKKVKESKSPKALVDDLLEAPVEEAVKCPECGSESVTHREKGTATTGAKFTCNDCRYAWKAPIEEATMSSGVPAFPSGGNPMSINSPRSRALPRRKSKLPPPKPHGVSPANS
jgi:predicted RNA-binding Zn-ribbon protein involved in translation (DUF1610 family)